MRMLLVNMPFANLRWPSLALGLLKAELRCTGIGCDVAYFNFDFAERVGLELYHWIADRFAFVLGGERLFARELFGRQLPDDDRYWRDVLLAADPRLTDDERRDLLRVAAEVRPFLDDCTAAVDWSRYAAVGFTASFQQTLAALCLAQRIKRIRPEIKVLLGGAACQGPMGLALLQNFPQLDYVFLGDADALLPSVAAQLAQGKTVRLPPGVAGRENIAALAHDLADSPPLVADLDEIPYPNFDDYFARLERSPLRTHIEPMLFFETSRGCWWGQKHQCAFCGLNGAQLCFRSKSPARAFAELEFLATRYKVRKVNTADNILDMRYLDTLMPQLANSRLELEFVYELKTNLDRRQVAQLLRAGLRAAQLGVETFSTAILRQIRKGATAAQNIQALKWFSAAGIEVKWNLLYGFPGEDPQQYAALAELLPALYHLAAPTAIGRVRVDRFSPYFCNPERYGIVNVRPHRAFRFVYPLAEHVVQQLAYYFEYDYDDGRDPLVYAAPLIAAAEAWQQLAGRAALHGLDRSDGVLLLTDTRPSAEQFQWRLTGTERAVYLFCDTARSWDNICRFVAQYDTQQQIHPPQLKRLLDRWIAGRIMAHIDDRYLALATFDWQSQVARSY